MEYLQAAVLGIVQGLTEFLPVSSTGHLILAEKLFGLSPTKFGLTFDAALHMGTLFALIVFFRKEVKLIVLVLVGFLGGKVPNSKFQIPNNFEFPINKHIVSIIIVSTIPAALFGVLLEERVETIFRNPLLVALSLIIFCIPMVLAEKLGKKNVNFEKVNFKDGLIIGFAQAVALIPGVSRSGITISTGMLRNLDRTSATRFAFLLSIPIIFGAGLKKLLETFKDVASGALPFSELTFFVVGIIFSFIFGYLAVRFLVSYLSKHGLWVFVWYRIILAILVLGLVRGV